MGAPADAIRELIQALADVEIVAAISHVKADIAEMRRAFPADEDFAAALRAVTRRLRNLRTEDGSELDHALNGWLRVKFSSTAVNRSDLRIIYRARDGGIELRAFGHRRDPESVYSRAVTRR